MKPVWLQKKPDFPLCSIGTVSWLACWSFHWSSNYADMTATCIRADYKRPNCSVWILALPSDFFDFCHCWSWWHLTGTSPLRYISSLLQFNTNQPLVGDWFHWVQSHPCRLHQTVLIYFSQKGEICCCWYPPSLLPPPGNIPCLQMLTLRTPVPGQFPGGTQNPALSGLMVVLANTIGEGTKR